jgi:hypothetical protein
VRRLVRDALTKSERRNIVDDLCPGIERGASHFRFRRVHGDHNTRQFSQSFDDRDDALQLLCRAHHFAARPRRFAADVDDVRALRQHFLGMREGTFEIAKLPAVTETIRRDVQDAHHKRALAEA